MKTCYGLYRAKVSNIEDPEQRGRIKVVCPEVIGVNVESAWCDPCVNVAYDKGGDFCLPALDEFVWVAFIAGNPNKPVYLGGWWKKESVPKDSYDELDNYRIIKYSNDRVIMQEDKILIEVEDEKTRATLTDKDITLEVGDKKTRAILDEDTITFEVGELQSRVKMEDDNIVLEIGDSDTEIRIESGEIYIKGNLHVDGEIYGTKSATLTENVSAKNGNFSNSVNAVNDVSSNNVTARNNISASNDLSGRSANLSVALDVNTLRASAAVYVNGKELSTHKHTVSTPEGTFDTSTPI